MEIWKNIEGYEGIYKVSNKGRVKLLNYRYVGSERILKAVRNKGYLRIGLTKNDKRNYFLIHRLVAEAFLDKSNFKYCEDEDLSKIDLDKLQVNHKNEIKTDNRVENLEWCTSKYNSNYGNRTKRLAHTKGKKVLCIETGNVYYSTGDASRKTGILQGSICQVCNGKLKSAGGYHWEYI